MSNRKTSTVGIPTIIFFIFLVLKLLKIEPVAHWSWWWVTVPFWGPMLIFTILTIYFISKD